MSVSKAKFVRDMLMAQEARKCAEKEAEAMQIIDGFRAYSETSVYESYMHNKRYSKGKICACTRFRL